MMNKELAEIAAALLRSMVFCGPRNTSVGICSNLTRGIDCTYGELAAAVMPELHQAFMSWPEFSGDEDYPVPHPEEGLARDAYSFPNLWGDDKYGEMRTDLALHCAKHFSTLAESLPE